MKSQFKEVDEVPFEIKEGRYYHAMFYFPFPPSEEHLLGGNVTGLIWRLDDEPESWRMTWRFRYYNTMDVHDRDDEKSWYTAHLSGPGPEVLPKAMECTKMLFNSRTVVYGDTKPNEPDKYYVLMIEGNSEKFMQLLMNPGKDWLNVSTLPKGETT